MPAELAAVALVITEILNGDALGMSAAARLIPAHRGHGRANPSTPWRWITEGAKAPDGRIVKLEAGRVAGRWLTSRAALARFIEALTPSDTSAAPKVDIPNPKKVASRSARASKRLQEIGC